MRLFKEPDHSQEMTKLTSDIDPNRHDKFGFDPWGMRVPRSTFKNYPNFASAIQDSTLNHADIQFNTLELNNPDNVMMVPKRIFILWLGSAFDANAPGRELIAGWRLKNPQHCITLLTDQLNKGNYQDLYATNPAAKDMIDFCNAHQICIASYQDLIPSEPMVELGLHLKSYGYASDVPRLILLREYGGVYVDIDIAPVTLQERILISPLAIGKHGGVDLCNDFLMAPSPNEQTRNLINRMLFKTQRLSSLTYSQFAQENKKNGAGIGFLEAYDERKLAHLSRDIKKYWTMYTSGPYALAEFSYECDGITDYTFFSHGTWLKSYTSLKQATDTDIIKRLVTNILFDLAREPAVLRLSPYITSLKSDVIAKSVSEILIKHFHKELKGVTHIIWCESLDLEVWINEEKESTPLTLTSSLLCARQLQVGLSNDCKKVDCVIVDNANKNPLNLTEGLSKEWRSFCIQRSLGDFNHSERRGQILEKNSAAEIVELLKNGITSASQQYSKIKEMFLREVTLVDSENVFKKKIIGVLMMIITSRHYNKEDEQLLIAYAVDTLLELYKPNDRLNETLTLECLELIIHTDPIDMGFSALTLSADQLTSQLISQLQSRLEWEKALYANFLMHFLKKDIKISDDTTPIIKATLIELKINLDDSTMDERENDRLVVYAAEISRDVQQLDDEMFELVRKILIHASPNIENNDDIQHLRSLVGDSSPKPAST